MLSVPFGQWWVFRNFSITGQRHSKPYCSNSQFNIQCIQLLLFVLRKLLWNSKPPAEPSPFQADPVDQVLFDNEFDTESQRKRTTSVSKMERMDSSLPEEEEDEDKEAVNGSGNAGL